MEAPGSQLCFTVWSFEHILGSLWHERPPDGMGGACTASYLSFPGKESRLKIVSSTATSVPRLQCCEGPECGANGLGEDSEENLPYTAAAQHGGPLPQSMATALAGSPCCEGQLRNLLPGKRVLGLCHRRFQCFLARRPIGAAGSRERCPSVWRHARRLLGQAMYRRCPVCHQ